MEDALDSEFSPPTPPQQPRLRAQHSNPAPNAGWPHSGRDALDHAHAVYSIVQHLSTLGLASWTSRLLQWLGRYDGLERHLEDWQAPNICVRDVLLRHVCRIPGEAAATLDFRVAHARRLAIVQDLLTLDLVRVRAWWGNEHRPEASACFWSPLEQCWLDFIEMPHGEQDWLCVDDSRQASRPWLQQLSRYLLVLPA